MYAYSGVLTALYERERTGRGTSFEVSLLDALGEWMSQPYYYAVYGGEEPPRTGARHAADSPHGPDHVRGRGGVLGAQKHRGRGGLGGKGPGPPGPSPAGAPTPGPAAPHPP